MKKVNLFLILGIFLMTAFVFTGCPKEPDDNTVDATVKVTGVTLTAPDGGDSTTLWVGEGAGSGEFPNSVELTAIIEPGDAANKEVEWTVFPAIYVSRIINGNKITITAVETSGTTATDITVKTKDGNFTKIHKIYVKTMSTNGNGGGDNKKELVLYNQAASPSAGTTTDLTAAWNESTKRYTIKNTYDNPVEAGFYNNNDTSTPPNISVQNATFVHFGTSLSGASSVSARVRISQRYGSGANTGGLIMGMFNSPDTASKDVKFVGIRIGTNGGEMRGYCSRPAGDNSATALSPVVNAAGWDQEFVLEVTRTSVTDYTLIISSSEGVELGRLTRSATHVVEINPAYLGFIVVRADVEISQIIIKEGSETVFSTPSTAPTAILPASVEFTTPVSGSGPYAYTHSISGGNNTIAISAKVLPAGAAQDITWTITGTGASLNTTTGGSVMAALTAAGEVIVTAAAAGTETKAALVLTVTSDSIPVSGITISAPGGSTAIMAGNGDIPPKTLQMSADVQPYNATYDNIAWSVSDTSTYTGAVTAAGGSINASTGVLTAAANQTADTIDIWVFAAAGGFNSAGYKITVMKYADNSVIWQYKAGDATISNNTTPQKINGIDAVRTGGNYQANETGLYTTGTSSSRFVLGYASPTYNTGTGGTSGTVYVTNGQLDLNRKFKVTIEYGTTSSTYIEVYLQNNGTSNANSVFGSNSRQSVTPTAAGGTAEFTFDTDALILNEGITTATKAEILAKSFLQFRVGAATLITGIVIEEVN